jgi:surfactin synthase thioesterase subunit
LALMSDELAARRSQTTNFRMELFDGGHFFLHASRAKALDVIGRTLDSVAASPAWPAVTRV